MADDVIKREDIIGAASKSYDFDKVLRGYDPRQVDEVIANLQKTNKSATEIFDQRIVDLKNKNEMLNYELDQAKQEADRMRNLFNQCKEERDALSAKLAKAGFAEQGAALDVLTSIQNAYGKETVGDFGRGQRRFFLQEQQ